MFSAKISSKSPRIKSYFFSFLISGMFMSKKKSNDDGENSISVYVYIVSLNEERLIDVNLLWKNTIFKNLGHLVAMETIQNGCQATETVIAKAFTVFKIAKFCESRNIQKIFIYKLIYQIFDILKNEFFYCIFIKSWAELPSFLMLKNKN